MAQRGYGYRVTVEPTSTPEAGAPVRPPLTFEATNHDDILAIVERVRTNAGLSSDDAASVAVGLKLLSEIMLRQKTNALFDPLRGGVREFIAGLKALNPPA